MQKTRIWEDFVLFLVIFLFWAAFLVQLHYGSWEKVEFLQDMSSEVYVDGP